MQLLGNILVNRMKNQLTNYLALTNNDIGPMIGGIAVGGAIKQAIAYDQREGDQSPSGNGDHGQYNMMFGFWASYYCTEAEKMGKTMFKWNTDTSKNDPDLGIVDIARVGRSQMYSEHQSGAFVPNDPPSENKENGIVTSRDWGLMQVNDGNFQNLKYKGIFSNLQGFWKNDLWKSNPFANIGAGMGEQFYLFTAPEYYKNEPNTLSTWQKIGLTYNTGVKYTTESYFNAINYNGDDKDYIKRREYGRRFNKHLLKNLGRR